MKLFDFIKSLPKKIYNNLKVLRYCNGDKAVLIFDISDCFGEQRHLRAACADSAFSVIHEILDELRTLIKYRELPKAQTELLENFRTTVCDIMSDHGIDLDNMYS